jgi:hypothetical protein
MQVRFKREWRGYSVGQEATIGAGVATELERRGYVERVEPERKVSVTPANKSRSRKG